MLSSIEYITNRVNAQVWSLGDTHGSLFENKIYHTILKQLQLAFPMGVRVYQTPASRDDGKDIIIESPIDLPRLLHYDFSLKGKEKINILVECKSTTQSQVRLEKIIGNVSRIKETGADYFVLVTNACITPYTHYRLYEDLRMYNIELVLVDQYLLSKYLVEQDEMFGEYPELDFCPGIEVEYQSMQTKINGRTCYELYISFRNYFDRQHHIELQLLTDRNWSISESMLEAIVEPHGHYIKKISVTREYSDGINDVIFKAVLGKSESQFHINGKNLVPMFEPPFLGENRIPIKNHLVKTIKNNRITFLYGDAGMGKTRLAQELFKELDGQNIDFGFFTVGRGDLLKKINEFLYKEVRNTHKLHTLSSLIMSYRNSYKHIILFIDDLHNADKQLLDGLRLLTEDREAPISLLLCGRTDYSAGSAEYFSFVQWAIESSTVNAIKLDPLTEADTRLMITRLINYVPQIVLERLTKLSQNNPLFIVQYIEYMLEVDLLTLVNRNTVGIQNMERFQEFNYMPDSIEEIYEARFNNLLNSVDKTLLESILNMCAVAHGALTSDQLAVVIEETSALDLLIERAFLRVDNDGNYSFIHESLYVYILNRLLKSPSKQRFIGKLATDLPAFYLSLERLDQGMLSLWAGKKEQSLERFLPAINQLASMENHSSFNIDIKIYDYLYFIYSLMEHYPEKEDMQKKIILARIYISLHYFTPQKAVEECQTAVDRITHSGLNNDRQLHNTLLEHQAHSNINAGHLVIGELTLKHLQGEYLLNPENLGSDTVYDMYDKFCNIYIKQNNYALAHTYNELSFLQAEKMNDNNLCALSYISKAKLNFYREPSIAYDNILEADKLLSRGISERIHCHNELSKLIYSSIYDTRSNWEELHINATKLLSIALKNSYGNSIIRAYMLLALSSYKKKDKREDVERFISRGIDASIQFGIGTYTWQFYNLQAVLYSEQGLGAQETMLLFNTVFSILGRQSLLYLGNCDFCYGNLLAISNAAFFWQAHDMESSFYQKLSAISFTGSAQICDYDCAKAHCGYICTDSLDHLKKQYMRAKEQRLLFCHEQNSYPLFDHNKKYYLIIS